MTRQRLSTPPLSERDFQRQITEYAELLGWEWVHCRAGRTVDSWRTPMSGTMARGWPDLVLVHVAERRVIFAEIKTDAGRLTVDQGRVLGALGSLMVEYPEVDEDFPLVKQRSYLDGIVEGMDRVLRTAPSIQVAVWRPSDWSLIEAALGRKKAA